MQEAPSRATALKLAQEAKALADWATVRDFAAQIYGEGKAARVKIETHEEYDDENYSYSIGEIAAYDKEGCELSPGYSLPFFATREWEKAVMYHDDEDYCVFARRLSTVTHWPNGKTLPSYILLEDLPQHDAAYDLATQPSFSSAAKEIIAS